MKNLDDLKVGDWVRQIGQTEWRQVTGASHFAESYSTAADLSTYTGMVNIAETCRITPITTDQFSKLKGGDRVRIAPEWYIRSKCTPEGSYSFVDYFKRDNVPVDNYLAAKALLYGKVVKIVSVRPSAYGGNRIIVNIHGDEPCHIHENFIVDVLAPAEKSLETTEVRKGDLVCDEGKWYRVDYVYPDKSQVTRLCDGEKTYLLAITLAWIPKVRSVADLQPQWFVKVNVLGKDKWCQVSSLDLTALKMENIADISTDKNKPHSTHTISVGDWVQWRGGPEWTQIDQIYTDTIGNPMYRERHPRGSNKFVGDITAHSKTNPLEITISEHGKSLLCGEKSKFDIQVGDWIQHPAFGNGNTWFEVSFASSTECHIIAILTHNIPTAEITAHKKASCPISDEQWDNLKEDHWVKIASEDYIRGKLGHDGRYFGIDYVSCERKTITYGTWQKVRKKHLSKPSVGVCDSFSIHRDFIVDTSEEQPKLTLKEFAYKISLEGYDYGDALEAYKQGSKGGSMMEIYAGNSGEKIREGSWVMLRDFVGYHRVHKITENPTQLNVGALNMWVKPNSITDSRIAIPDQEWDKLTPGMWVKIASQEYIKSVCRIDSFGNWMHKNNNYEIPNKMKMFGKWGKVASIDIKARGEVQCEGFYWHRDFIVDVSATDPLSSSAEPLDSLRKFTAPTSGTYEITVGDKETARITLPEGYTLKVDEKSVLTEEQWKILIDNSKPGKGHWIYSEFKTKQQETIMLNTVEEIGKLAKPNLEEAAKQVKASRDNDEVAAAKKKLVELLDSEFVLKNEKERVDKRLAEVQELIKALGYPPKDNEKYKKNE